MSGRTCPGLKGRLTLPQLWADRPGRSQWTDSTPLHCCRRHCSNLSHRLPPGGGFNLRIQEGINVTERLNSPAGFNLGGGEIILILVLLIVLAVVAVGFFGLIYLIVRAVLNRPAQTPSALPHEV